MEQLPFKNTAIIGDDLTGCMDTGVVLAKRGYTTDVVIDFSGIPRSDCVVVDTKSRNVSSAEALDIVTDALMNIRRGGYRLIYMKTDSTLRGNIGAYMTAALDNGFCDMVLFAPALPSAGRTTVNGVHYLDNSPVTCSDLAKDPFSPVSSSNLRELLSEQTPYKCRVLDLRSIREGTAAVVIKMEQFKNDGYSIICADSQNDRDLEIIAKAVSQSTVRILPCGSAGLFGEMCTGHVPDWKDIPERNSGPVLIINGSPARKSKLQIERAMEKGMEYLIFDPLGDLDNKDISEKVIAWLRERKDVIIDGAGEGKKEISDKYGNDRIKVQEDGNRIKEKLAELVYTMLENVTLAGLVVIGGDTAAAIFERLGAVSIRITGEAEPLVPAGMIKTKDFDGLRVITKAGGFGSDDVIIKCIEHLT